jgi:TonB family protein
MAAGQQPTASSLTPNDPRALLDAAAKYYDFNAAELKPWHLKATYQLYDLKGKPAEQGTWEYWWVAPKVYRNSWTRAGAERTEWRSSDGKLYRKESGLALKYFERNIGMSVFPSLPSKSLLDAGKMRLELKTIPVGTGQLACVTSIMQLIADGKPKTAGPGLPAYNCFDASNLVLRTAYSNQVRTDFGRIVKTQGRYLARDVAISIGKQTAFSLTVNSIDGIDAANPALTPAADATVVYEEAPKADVIPLADDVAVGMLVKKAAPVYPMIAKAAHVQGVVVLAATIGKDGKIHNLEVLGTPSSLLTGSAVDAVKSWEYKPYLLNGEPVEVESVIDVTYKLDY